MTVAISIEDKGTSPSIYGFQYWPEKAWGKVLELAKNIKKIGEDDPRRIIHSIKAGIAITLVSLLYYIQPLYNCFGVNTTWAVMTAVVIFEFSVGATLGKGINRMLATVGAGALALGVHSLSTLFGDIGEPVVSEIFVFAIAAMVSFARFFPKLKARCDYGLMIFILTFSLVSVSGYREENIVKMAVERLSTITVGCCITILVSTCICPVWIGEDLHNLVALNMEKLADFLEGFRSEYFGVSEDGLPSNNKTFLQRYKSILSSQSSEESMANLARWEPGHGRFSFFHPWKQYLKIGALIRQCAIKIDALNSYLNPRIQTPWEIRGKIKEQCTKITIECGKALKELSSSMKMMIRTENAHFHIGNSKDAAENLKAILKTSVWEEAELLEIAQATAVASLLMEIVQFTERIGEALQELASLAGFKTMDPLGNDHQCSSQRMHSIDLQNHEITIGE